MSLLLQAAMGLGLLLMGLGMVIVLVLFPTVWITTTLRRIASTKKKVHSPDWRAYAFCVLEGFSFGILAVLVSALLIILSCVLFIDLDMS
jgi:hypothetical protein